MKIKEIQSKSILSPQSGGFLSHSPYPFTHSLSPYTGCGYGTGYCGQFCYAATLASWQYKNEGEAWGDLVIAKMNAPDLLNTFLAKCKDRSLLRIFFSPATDPWQPQAEGKHKLTQQCLDVFSQYDDLGLLVMQTRSTLAERDLERMASIPYLWLSVTLETDLQSEVSKLGYPNSPLTARRKLITRAAEAQIPVQVAVSPCLPHSEAFADQLLSLGAGRIIIDNFIDGDGSRGVRTAESPFAEIADYDWQHDQQPRQLFKALSSRKQVVVTWSSEGFCSIPSQAVTAKPQQLEMF